MSQNQKPIVTINKSIVDQVGIGSIILGSVFIVFALIQSHGHTSISSPFALTGNVFLISGLFIWLYSLTKRPRHKSESKLLVPLFQNKIAPLLKKIRNRRGQ